MYDYFMKANCYVKRCFEYFNALEIGFQIFF